MFEGRDQKSKYFRGSWKRGIKADVGWKSALRGMTLQAKLSIHVRCPFVINIRGLSH